MAMAVLGPLGACKKSPPSDPPPRPERRLLHPWATAAAASAQPVDGGAGLLRSIVLEENGFADIALAITDVRRTGEGALDLTARGLYRDDKVGLEVLLVPPPSEGGTPTGSCAVTFKSLGAESDRLVAALGELYRLPRPKARMVPGLRLSTASLDGDARHPADGLLTLKLFSTGRRAADSAGLPGAGLDGLSPMQLSRDPDAFELYLSLDLTHRTLELAEKDETYRAAVLRALAGR